MTAPAEHGINVPLLRKVLEHITEHPEEHDQSVWATRNADCGTALCVAGHAVVMSGHGLLWGPGDIVEHADYVESGRPIRDVAAELLGLPLIPHTCDDECYEDDCCVGPSGPELFNGENSINDLWRIAGELTHGEIVRLVTS